MRRAALFAVAMTMMVGGCSKGDEAKPRSAEEPGARAGAVGAGGAGANVRSDADFLRDVAVKNIAAMEFSRIAEEKATSPQVKAFAQSIIADHGSAFDKLKSAVSGQ